MSILNNFVTSAATVATVATAASAASAASAAQHIIIAMNLAGKGKQLAWQAGKPHRIGYGSHFRIMTQIKNANDMFGTINLCRVNRDEVGNIIGKEPVYAQIDGKDIILDKSLRNLYINPDEAPGTYQHMVISFAIDGEELQDKVREIFEDGGEGGHIKVTFESLRLKAKEWTKTYNRTDEYDLNLSFDITDIQWYPKALVDESRLLVLQEEHLVYKKPVSPEDIKQRLSASLKALITAKAVEVKTGIKSIGAHIDELATYEVDSEKYIVLKGALMLKAEQNNNQKAIEIIAKADQKLRNLNPVLPAIVEENSFKEEDISPPPSKEESADIEELLGKLF
jgi:hypothetical protein